MIITYNEAPNIGRTLDRLTWARRIVVIDSGSTDGTLDVIRTYPQVEVVHRDFDDFATQCDFGIAQVATKWVLSLDADYILSEELVSELWGLEQKPDVSGYQARFVYCIYGRSLRGTLYPPRTVLFRKDTASHRNEGHGHRVAITGNISPLSGVIFHDDRKPLSRWFLSQQSYAKREAVYLLGSQRDSLNLTDKIRLAAWPAPLGAFLYALLVKGCLLDGWPGWYYAFQRLLAETLISLELIERRSLLRSGEQL